MFVFQLDVAISLPAVVASCSNKNVVIGTQCSGSTSIHFVTSWWQFAFFSDMDTIIKSHSHWTWVISIEEKCIELWVSNKIFGGDQNCPSSSGTRWDEPMHKKGKKTTVAVQNRSFHLIWIIIIASVQYCTFLLLTHFFKL